MRNIATPKSLEMRDVSWQRLLQLDRSETAVKSKQPILIPSAGRVREVRHTLSRCPNSDKRSLHPLRHKTQLSSRHDRSGAEPPGSRWAASLPRQSAARTSFALGDAPSARSRDSRWEFWRGAGVDTHKGGLGGGGSRGCVTRHLLAWRGADPRRDVLRLSAGPAPSPGRSTVASSHPA
jgi:hypothetical protein